MPMHRVPLLITEIRRRNPSHGAPRYKIALVKEAGSVYITSKSLTTPRQVYEAVAKLFEGADRELFYVLCLDTKSKIIGVNLVTLGWLTGATIHPREVYKAAILLNASAIICVHNHPSGNPAPSQADGDITHRLFSAGEILGIPLKDHVIVGENNYFSYTDTGSLS
jgi:DNA repair protein RadC